MALTATIFAQARAGCRGDMCPWTSSTTSSPCICDKSYLPVCCNGQTFANQCLAGCAGNLECPSGACPDTASTSTTASPTNSSDCVCTKIYTPVCCDGEEYGNECLAKCAGHSNCDAGACPVRTGFCKANTHCLAFTNDCNHCVCTGNGEEACTMKLCIDTPMKSKKTCTACEEGYYLHDASGKCKSKSPQKKAVAKLVSRLSK